MISIVRQQLKENGYVWDLGQLDQEILNFFDRMIYNGELLKNKEYWNGIIKKTIYRLK